MILLMLQPRWVSPLRTDQQRRCVLINFPFDGLEGRATKTSSTAPIVIIPIVKAERKKRRSTRRGGRGAHTCKECSHCSAVRVTFIIKLAPQLPMRAEQLRSYKLREEIACMSSRHCAAPVCFVCTRGQCSKPLELAVVRAVRPSVRGHCRSGAGDQRQLDKSSFSVFGTRIGHIWNACLLLPRPRHTSQSSRTNFLRKARRKRSLSFSDSAKPLQTRLNSFGTNPREVGLYF